MKKVKRKKPNLNASIDTEQAGNQDPISKKANFFGEYETLTFG